MPSDIENTSSTISQSLKVVFLSTYLRQNFSLSKSIMYYIAKNPKNKKVYQKMIKCCKYFFVKNPILIIFRLRYNKNGWKYLENSKYKKIDMKNFSGKLWLTNEFHAYSVDHSNKNDVSLIIPKIYRCDVKELSIYEQVVSLNEFMILCLSAYVLGLHQVTVKYEDGTVVLFGKLIKQLPNIIRFSYTFEIPSNNASKNTFKELWKIPHFSNYYNFFLKDIPEDFDIDSFYPFMKKNQSTDVYLKFSDQISEAYKIRLEAIVDEIIGTKKREYKPPYIEFPGLDKGKIDELHEIFWH